MAKPEKKDDVQSRDPLDVTLLDFYGAPVLAALAAAEWSKGKAGNHAALAAHALRFAHAALAEREKPFVPVVVSEGKREVPPPSLIEEPLQEIAPQMQIVAPDGSVASIPDSLPPSPLSPETDLKKIMMGET